MYDYVRQANLTTKPCSLAKDFTLALHVGGYSTAFGNSFMENYATAQ